MKRFLGFLLCAAMLWGCGQLAAPGGDVERPAAPVATQPNRPPAVREAFLKIIDRPRVPLAATETQDADGALVRVRFQYSSQAGQRVPGIVLKRPGEARQPVVMVLHGTGGSKEGELSFMRELAGKGFVAVAIDGRYHGERGKPADYNAAIARAFEKGGEHPLYYDTVWDIMRLIDYLQTRADVDPKRIGIIGISKGGIETYFAAAVDERIAVAVPCIGMQSFKWELEHDAWHERVGTFQSGFDAAAKSAGIDKPDAAFARAFFDRLTPEIHGVFDGPEMAAQIAPRPLLIVNGAIDGKTPLAGVNLCAQSAKAAYVAQHVPEKFRQIVEPDTGHKVTRDSYDQAIAWFVKWL